MNAADNFPWKGSNSIYEENKKAKDAYGTELNLYEGTYEMMNCKFPVMIKKGPDHLELESYDFLRNFTHDNAIRLLDYYTDKKNKGCLVIPRVDTTFENWLNAGGSSQLFSKSGHLTLLFKDMIIGLCGLIGSLNAKMLIIERFDHEDLFICLASMKLQVLLAKVKQVKVLGVIDKKNNWNHIRRFIDWCAKSCNVKKNTLTEHFCQYLGESHYKVEYLRAYPDDWDYEKKGTYLMALVASDHGELRQILNNARVGWPYKSLHRVQDNLPRLLSMIIDWEDNEGRKLSLSDPVDYIILLRNIYKHYKGLSEEIKAFLIDRNAIIKMAEEWTTNIWIEIYERAGWPRKL